MTRSAQIADLRRKLAGLDGLRRSLVREQQALDHAGIQPTRDGNIVMNTVLRDRARHRQAVIQRQLADSAVAERIWRRQLHDLTVVMINPVPRRTASSVRTPGGYLHRALGLR
jgi:hypothetical protein